MWPTAMRSARRAAGARRKRRKPSSEPASPSLATRTRPNDWRPIGVCDEEIKALNEGKKEVFAEAKGEGFDVKVLREILRLRKQDKDERDEQESLLDLYLRAMESTGSSQAKAA